MLKKDIMELCLLQLLSGQDRYGYELLQILHKQFPDTQESTVYAILRNLCKEHYLETYTGDISGGPARKYYRIGKKGKERLTVLLNEWKTLIISMKGIGL